MEAIKTILQPKDTHAPTPTGISNNIAASNVTYCNGNATATNVIMMVLILLLLYEN